MSLSCGEARAAAIGPGEASDRPLPAAALAPPGCRESCLYYAIRVQVIPGHWQPHLGGLGEVNLKTRTVTGTGMVLMTRTQAAPAQAGLGGEWAGLDPKLAFFQETPAS